MTDRLITPADWFWPIVAAQRLAGNRQPDTYPLPFHFWLGWHYSFVLHGEGFIACTAERAADLLQLPEAA